jgi:hypothetical protein
MQGMIEHSYSVGVLSRAPLPELVVFSEDGHATLEVWLRDIDPSETTAFDIKTQAWATNAAARFVADIKRAIESGGLS